jgi:hypothetical protein
MLRKSGGRSAAPTKASLAGAVLAVSLLVLCTASSALATPKGEFAVFADCPVTTASACLHASTETGEFIVGKKKVPITKTITLQGGLREVEGGNLEFVAAQDGNTLSKVPQKVPGGLLGIVDCTQIKGTGWFETGVREACEAIFENGFTGVNATTELAAPASAIGINLGNLLGGEGTALLLPVKVHLENPLFGAKCYIGSNAAPIMLELTTGTTAPPLPNKPIKGNPGTLTFNPEGTLFTISKNSLVNNSFAAPATNGCGEAFEFLIGPIVNGQLGVPSAAGHNTAILNGTLQQAGTEIVQEHE